MVKNILVDTAAVTTTNKSFLELPSGIEQPLEKVSTPCSNCSKWPASTHPWSNSSKHINCWNKM